MAFALASRNVDPGPNLGTALSAPTLTRTVTANGTVNSSLEVVDAHSLLVVVNISSFTSGTLTVTIKGSSATGAQWTILASSALAAAAITVLRVSPDLTASANATAQDIVPPNVVISAAAAGGASFVYAIDAECGY